MMRFLRAQAASITASIIDFLVTILVVEIFDVGYVAATVTGNIVGGLSNFLLGRQWVFEAQHKNAVKQVLRYAVVWCGNLFLNGLGMYLLTDQLTVGYVIAKIVVSIFVGISYNYLLQRVYVFS